MKNLRKNPRILMVTPEITYLPEDWPLPNLKAKVGGLADVTSALVQNLFRQGVDVHLTIPDYRTIFSSRLSPSDQAILDDLRFKKSPEDRLHLAEDRAFYYVRKVYAHDWHDNARLAVIFQREVINNIIPRVQPDIIHCNDWTTALIPAAARRLGIPCLFTLHNIHTYKATLSFIEYWGIDAANFWRYMYYQRTPYNYEETRESNPIDFLTTGIFAAHFVNTVGPEFLNEIADGRHNFVDYPIQTELRHKRASGCAVGILNAPDPAFHPSADKILIRNYGVQDYADGKRENKLYLQQLLGLRQDADAPMFFWPSRLDPVQKGCQLLAHILYQVISEYRDKKLQIVFVADGEYQHVFRDILHFHKLEDCVAVHPFSEQSEHLGYAASDFMLMPSRFEPCGLPQMIAPIYGSLPVAHDTGGIHDTIEHLDAVNNSGNGFLFKTFDSAGLLWAIGEAMKFYNLPLNIRASQIERIMTESASGFTHSQTAKRYTDLYETMLSRPLLTP